MKTDFLAYSVAYGLRQYEFEDMDPRTVRKLLRLMARISESSFRRGFQQGTEFRERGVKTVDPAYLRFDVSLERSPFTHAPDSTGLWITRSGFSSAERLETEYGELCHLFASY